jgi:hypothetical protein
LHQEGIHAKIFIVPIEIETTLIILGENPELLMGEIASRAFIGAYRLIGKGTKVLQDTYYDTQMGYLSGQGIAVRTREKAGSVLFCIKQRERIEDAGAAVREELELPWSMQCMDHVAQIMQNAPMNLNEICFRLDSPSQCLACLGLVPIQTRETRRQAFDISRSGKEGIIAELALDEVCYFISGCCILHYEIEVEAKGPSCEPDIMHLTDLIRQAYPDRLTRWGYNKLLTGLAVERLISEGMLAVQPGKALHLSRSSYNAIDVFLKKSL